MSMMSRRFTTWQILRYPLVFGSCLAAYGTAFSFRKAYFNNEIEEQRERNFRLNQQNMSKIEAAKQEALSSKGQKPQRT